MRRQIVDCVTIESDNVIRIGTRIHGSGTITDTFVGEKPQKSMCKGCRDDFYNGQGAAECWGFKTAKVVNKVGHATLNTCNGPDVKMLKTLSCWHAVSR